VSSKAQHQVQGLNEEIKRLERERSKVQQTLAAYKSQARRDHAELKMERDELTLQCKDLRQELQVLLVLAVRGCTC
jgi:archaellum component FlaC